MNNVKKPKNKQKQTRLIFVIAYELGFRLIIWIAAPIIIALFVGKWLDTYYQTTGPIFFSCFIGFAFLVSTIGIVKESHRSMKLIDDIDKNKDEQEECTDKTEKK